MPFTNRTRYHPFCDEHAWKVRNLILHLCHFDEKRRQQREFFDNIPFLKESLDYLVWQLPKNVKEMNITEIADFQPGPHGTPSKFPPITLKEYIKTNKLNLNN